MTHVAMGHMDSHSHPPYDDGTSCASELSHDPYAENIDVMSGGYSHGMGMHHQKAHEVPMHHGVYAAQHAHQAAPVPHQYWSVVHPSGRTAWVPMAEGGCTVANMRDEVGRQLQVQTQDLGQICRVLPMAEDTPIDRQCMSHELLYILPTARPQDTLPQSQYYPAAEMASQPVTPLMSVPSTPMSNASFAYQNNVSVNNPGFVNNATPLHGAAPWPMILEEKLAAATQNLTQVISQSRQCTELQQDLEQAVARGIDCSAVFEAVERMLADIILHPSGNYLVSKCFELCPALIDSASAVMRCEVARYALHKHGSYVAEAILTSTRASQQAKGDLIKALMDPQTRGTVASHDSGNFVLQKAIENCPDHLLPVVQEGVHAVVHQSTHGAKMMKKLEARLARSAHNGGGHAQPVHSSTLPLPASTASYLNQLHSGQEQVRQEHAPPPLAAPKTIVTSVPAAGVVEKTKVVAVGNELRQGSVQTISWADDEASPPRQQQYDSTRVPLP